MKVIIDELYSSMSDNPSEYKFIWSTQNISKR